MIRPWKVFLSVAVGAAVLPASAMAAPSITITSPENGKTYDKGSTLVVNYSCAETIDCVGTKPDGSPLPNGSTLDTSTVGMGYITVTARTATSTLTQQSVYFVEAPGTTDPGGEVPAVLNLTLGNPTAFSPFVPGVARDYTTSLTANILSTAGDATLTVADAADTNVGKLVNGAFALPTPVQVGASKTPETGPAPAPSSFAPLGGSAAPTQLLSYDGPVNGSAVVTFKQAIAASDALRTGSYSKTLTFTLSTTNP